MGGVFGATRYVALFLTDDTELSGHGYSREDVTSAQASVHATTGVVTFPTNLEIYTANDDSAQRAQRFNIMDAATGGSALLEDNAVITAPPLAPVNGQTFRMSITVTP